MKKTPGKLASIGCGSLSAVAWAIRPLLASWRDAAWAIVSKGENDSLDGCYWLLHTDNLQHALFVPAAAPEVRQAADALVTWLNGTRGNDGGNLIERLDKAGNVLNDDKLTVDEKLWKIDALMPIPPTVSAAKLGKALGVTKTAVQNTSWYIQKRKGQKNDEIGRRHEQHRQRGLKDILLNNAGLWETLRDRAAG